MIEARKGWSLRAGEKSCIGCAVGDRREVESELVKVDQPEEPSELATGETCLPRVSPGALRRSFDLRSRGGLDAGGRL